jgi:hypothetical protein
MAAVVYRRAISLLLRTKNFTCQVSLNFENRTRSMWCIGTSVAGPEECEAVPYKSKKM